MTEFYLITGFLGSGKTTLLKNLLRELGSQRRIAVIQNEYAPTGIDGKELRQVSENFKLIEINNGSVFCVCQLSNFEQTAQKLIDDYQPEIIFLEASGLADPISIAELLGMEGLRKQLVLGKIITLVDLPNFEMSLKMMPRFKHQLMIADKVIANKKDLFKGDLDHIREEVKKLNPYAEVSFTEHANVDWEALCQVTDASGMAYQRFSDIEAAGRPDWSCSVLRTHETVEEEKLREFITTMQIDSPRIKGFINLNNGTTVSIQTSFDQVEIVEVSNYTGRGELIVFSPTLTPLEIKKRFLSSIEK